MQCSLYMHKMSNIENWKTQKTVQILYLVGTHSLSSQTQRVVFPVPAHSSIFALSVALTPSPMGNSSKDNDSATSADASAGDVQPSNSAVYSEGEKVLAYHGPRIYEAKASFTSPLPVSFNFLFQLSFISLDLPLPLVVFRLEFYNYRNGNLQLLTAQ